MSDGNSRSLFEPFKSIQEANDEFHKITRKYNEDLQTINIRNANIDRIKKAYNDYMKKQQELFDEINEKLRIANEEYAMINDANKSTGGKKRKTRKVKKGKKTKKSKKSRKYKK